MFKFLLFLLSLSSFSLCLDPSSPSYNAQLYHMEGPGLNPGQVILPCRYFFVEKDVEDATNASRELQVSIEGENAENKGKCRAWVEVFDTPQLSYIVRYKFHSSCDKVVLRVTLGGHHIQGSPRYLGYVLADACRCPLKNLREWVSSSQCPAPVSQMEEDLKMFPKKVDMKEEVERAKELLSNRASQCWCHYAIKDGVVFRKCYGQHVGFHMFWDHVFSWLSKRATLPDLEMMVNLGDWPLVAKTISPPLPMFSWCGSPSTQDMLFPTYDLTEASLECMGRQQLDVLASMGKNKVPWKEKEEKVFWRGRDSRRERLDLAEMSLKYPHLINASLTAFFFFRDEEKRLGKAPYISFFDFFNYKYQLNIDGTVAAYRFPYLLAGSGVVFKQESQYYEHFYRDLKPYEHYLPINKNIRDLPEKVEAAKESDHETELISNNGQKFAKHHLTPLNILCYHAQLLDRWAQKMGTHVQIGEGMERVSLEDTENRYKPSCDCVRFYEHQKTSFSKDEL